MLSGRAVPSSKAGLHGLTHSYANLLVKEGITCNAIAPALIDTNMIRGNPAITPATASGRTLRHRRRK